MADRSISHIVKWKDAGNLPEWPAIAHLDSTTKAYWAQWDSLDLKEGVLYHRWESPERGEETWQLVLPTALRAGVLNLLHDSPVGGHLGVSKTLGKVCERFYWIHCRRDVEEWCHKCDLCGSRKAPRVKTRSPLQLYNVGEPMERVAIDVLGPLPETESGNKYILIAMEYFSKWPEAYALPNQEAVTVANVLVSQFFGRFGVPAELHADQGRNFESHVFQEVCTLLGIHKTRTTALYPQSDGMVERYNRTLENQLATFVQDHQKDWDLHLPLLLMSYRSAVHETTKLTPGMLMFGRELRVPLDLLLGRPQADIEEQSYLEYAERLRASIGTVHDFARDHQQAGSQRMKRRYDIRSEAFNFSKGGLVWLYNPQRKKGKSPKLSRPWEGLYVVVERLNDVVYRIQRGPRAKPKVVHSDRLWQYRGDACADWFNEPHEGQGVNLPEGATNCQEVREDTTRSNAASRRTQRRGRKPPRFRRNVSVASNETLPLQRGQDTLRRSDRSRRRALRCSDFVAR